MWGGVAEGKPLMAKMGEGEHMKLTIDYQPTDTSRELALCTINESYIYHNLSCRIIDNLSKKLKKGIYDPEKAVKAFYPAVDLMAKRYVKEFCANSDVWYDIFPASDRRLAAAEVLNHYADHIQERSK
jgi:uridine kinase